MRSTAATWVFFAAIVAIATSYETGERLAREYGAPGPGGRSAGAGAREGRYIPLPPGARVYFAHPGSARLFRDVDSAIAGLPDGDYKLFYTPALQ